MTWNKHVTFFKFIQESSETNGVQLVDILCLLIKDFWINVNTSFCWNY